MHDFPTHASVTGEQCCCSYLQRAAEDTQIPIVFDESTNEYHFLYQELELCGPAMLVIYHGPFCGGAAPKSKRATLFARITAAEESRIAEMMRPIDSIDTALARLGPPDFDEMSITRSLETQNVASQIQHHRNIRYFHLSDVAEIWLEERPDGKITWHLQGKYLGHDSTEVTG